MSNILFGVSGDKGSFSEEAGLLYAKTHHLNVDLQYLINMENVLAAIHTKQIDLGIFPVVNKRGGLVSMAFAAMGKYPFEMIDELWLTVHQCVLVKKGVRKEELKHVVSHPQALAQCQQYIQNHLGGIAVQPAEDTALAARQLAEDHLSHCTAVLAPRAAAKAYGLELFAENVEDEQPNLTAFIIVRKR